MKNQYNMVQDFKLLHLQHRDFKSTEVQWRCVADLKRTQSNSQGLRRLVQSKTQAFSDQRFHALLFSSRSHPFYPTYVSLEPGPFPQFSVRKETTARALLMTTLHICKDLLNGLLNFSSNGRFTTPSPLPHGPYFYSPLGLAIALPWILSGFFSSRGRK